MPNMDPWHFLCFASIVFEDSLTTRPCLQRHNTGTFRTSRLALDTLLESNPCCNLNLSPEPNRKRKCDLKDFKKPVKISTATIKEETWSSKWKIQKWEPWCVPRTFKKEEMLPLMFLLDKNSTEFRSPSTSATTPQCKMQEAKWCMIVIHSVHHNVAWILSLECENNCN